MLRRRASAPSAAAAVPAATVRSARAGTVALDAGAVFYAIALAFHAADHARRGIGLLTPEVFWAGIVSTGAALVAIVLVLRRSSYGPAAAMLTGFANAAGVAAVHLAPPLGPAGTLLGAFSDSFAGTHAAWSSWAAVSIEIVAALVFGTAGFLVLRREVRAPLRTPR